MACRGCRRTLPLFLPYSAACLPPPPPPAIISTLLKSWYRHRMTRFLFLYSPSFFTFSIPRRSVFLAGMLYDATGSYSLSFYVAGSTTLFTAVMFMMMAYFSPETQSRDFNDNEITKEVLSSPLPGWMTTETSPRPSNAAVTPSRTL